MMPTFNHTSHIKKQIVKHVITSLTTNIMPRIKPQNGPTFFYVAQGPHTILRKTQATLIHLSTLTKGNYFPI